MMVYLLIYLAISFSLITVLEYYRNSQGSDLTANERDVFSFIEERPISFYFIFITISPILLVFSVMIGVLTYISEAIGKDDSKNY